MAIDPFFSGKRGDKYVVNFDTNRPRQNMLLTMKQIVAKKEKIVMILKYFGTVKNAKSQHYVLLL